MQQHRQFSSYSATVWLYGLSAAVEIYPHQPIFFFQLMRCGSVQWCIIIHKTVGYSDTFYLVLLLMRCRSFQCCISIREMVGYSDTHASLSPTDEVQILPMVHLNPWDSWIFRYPSISFSNWWGEDLSDGASPSTRQMDIQISRKHV